MPQPPDILVFMSDQHNARLTENAGDPFVSTPNLTRLAADGVEFTNAYTSCPLCVPARASMLTGRLPSATGIFGNSGAISSEQATFAHSLGAAGYETVLCGRMHFLGPDQFHGFTRRLVGDFTPCYWGRYGSVRADLGPYVGTPAGEYTKLHGAGTSPVLEYDHAVTAAALEYLARPHERPVFMLLGCYGPHHTYVAPPELYRKYLDLVGPADSEAHPEGDLHPALAVRARDFEPDVVRSLRAAYYGLVEHTDRQVGLVRAAWDEHLERTGREGVFCYLSDHGDQAGEKRLWGKVSFLEGSSRIPMIFAGAGVASGARVESPVSIMDLGPTLCELAGAEAPPEPDGLGLAATLKTGAGGEADENRAVLSELIDKGSPARMVRRDRWKYFGYAGSAEEDRLYDVVADPYEYVNLAGSHPDEAAELRAVLDDGWDPEAIVREQRRRRAHWDILSAWGAEVDVDEPHRWVVPESSWKLPEA